MTNYPQYHGQLVQALTKASQPERTMFPAGEVVDLLLDLMNALEGDERHAVEQEALQEVESTLV